MVIGFGEVSDIVEISIDGQDYRLAREEIVRRVLGADARRWGETRVKVATKRQPRSNVRPGDAPDEWVITYDDWSGGVTGSHTPLLGKIHISDGDSSHAGSLRSLPTNQSESFSAPGAAPAAVLEFNDDVFVFAGRYVRKFHGDGSTEDKDFGAGVTVTDAKVFNNEIVVGFGGSTNKIQSRNTGGTWTAATDATYADYFGNVEDRLWRGTATNEVSNIGPTDNPLTLTNWSSGITVGDDDKAITDLNGQKERLWVSKVNGLHPGDAGAIFPNVLPHIETLSHTDNGKNTLVRGSQILYPYRAGGLSLYENGSSQEVGLREVLDSVVPDDDNVPGHEIGAMCLEGEYIWAATKPSYYPRAAITGFRKTTDKESSYTDYTSKMNDFDLTDGGDLSSLDTGANGDYFYIGYATAKWYGAYLHIEYPNSNATTLAAEYWNGSAWAALTEYDGTSDGTNTLAQSGVVTWATLPGSWASSTIDGTAAYWVRFNVSAALDTAVFISGCRIITSGIIAHIYRIRSGEVGEPRLVWQPMWSVETMADYISTMMVAGPKQETNVSQGTLYAVDQLQTHYIPLFTNTLDYPLHGWLAVDFYLPKDDAGMPEMNKQWLDLTIKGRTVDANHTVDVSYRADEAASYTTLVSNVSSSPTRTAFSSVTGYALQVYPHFDAAASQVEPTEINEIEVRFRELPTWKNQYTVMLEIADGQAHSGPIGGTLLGMDAQLSNLEGDQGAGTITVKDPVGREKSMTVDRVEVVEYLQTGMDTPTLFVQCVMTEI